MNVLSDAVTALSLSVDADGMYDCSDGSRLDGPTVLGEPFHATTRELLETYDARGLEAYLGDEARHGVGNYVLADPERNRLITSPGYAGGYVDTAGDSVTVGTTVGAVLEEREFPAELRTDVYEHYFRRDVLTLPPYRTVFRDIDRLPPAYVLEVDDGGTVRGRGYVGDGADSAPPSFDRAFDEVMASLADRLRGTSRTVVVLFSGGIDSLCLLVGIRKYLPADQVRVVSCDDGYPTDGPPMARRITASMDVELDVVSPDWEGWPPRTDEVIECTERSFSVDFIMPIAPHYGIGRDRAGPDDVLLSGMNFGAWVRGIHAGETTPYWQGFAPTTLLKHVLTTTPPVKRLLSELAFTDSFISGSAIKYLFYLYFSLAHRTETVSFDPSLTGYLQGMLRTKFPTIVNRTDVTPHARYELEPELDRFFTEVSSEYTEQTVYQFLYYWFCQNGQKILTTLPGPSGANVHLPVTWGPVASYFLSTSRPWYHVFAPKRPYYEYVRQQTGHYYHDITGLSVDELESMYDRSESQRAGGWTDLYAARNREVLDPASSRVIQQLEGDLAEEVTAEYRSMLDAIESGSGFSTPELNSLYRSINIESLLGGR